MKRSATFLLPLMILAAACSMVPGLGVGGGAGEPAVGVVAPAPAKPAAEMRPDLLVIDPAIAAPGDVVALAFPEETMRGVLFVLDERTEAGWVPRFFLLSDGPGAEWQMSWHPVAAEGIAVEDIGVGGPGLDRVPIPDTAEPGTYRICTGNAAADFCAPIDIVAP